MKRKQAEQRTSLLKIENDEKEQSEEVLCEEKKLQQEQET